MHLFAAFAVQRSQSRIDQQFAEIGPERVSEPSGFLPDPLPVGVCLVCVGVGFVPLPYKDQLGVVGFQFVFWRHFTSFLVAAVAVVAAKSSTSYKPLFIYIFFIYYFIGSSGNLGNLGNEALFYKGLSRCRSDTCAAIAAT